MDVFGNIAVCTHSLFSTSHNCGRQGSMAMAENVQDVPEGFSVGFNPTVLAEVISHVSQGTVEMAMIV